MRRPRNEHKLKRKLRFLLLTNPLMIYKTIDGHVLTRDAARILMCCIYDINDAFYYDYQIEWHHLDCYLEKYMNHTELFTSLRYLQKLGYVENLIGCKDDFEFNLTYEGMNYFEIRRKNFIYLIINSVLLPIVISIGTTLLTLAITGALQTLP